jgi:RNA recognition motif-containing protein
MRTLQQTYRISCLPFSASLRGSRQIKHLGIPELLLFVCLEQKEHFLMANKLYVGNLNYQTQEHELRDLFAQHGEVLSSNVITDRDTGRSRGFGFVEMGTEEEARSAERALDGQDFDGRQLKVNEAKPRNNDRSW